MKKTIVILLSIIISANIFAQQNPTSIKWMEINSEHTKIIFPEEIKDEAQRVANMIDFLYPYETKTLKTKPKKLPIILLNQSTTSNGYAALRPRRSVWNSTPSQYASSLGTDNWYYTLGVHEYRHIVQYSTSNNYLTRVFSTLFGQTGLLFGEYSIPYWFFEGDAVTTETSMSKLGRGRIPQFEMPIRTMLLSDKKISYDKAKLGSYKHFTPGYYNLGYQIASQARVMYGADVWDKTLKNTSKISFWPWAFSQGMRRATGLTERKMYKKVMHQMDSVWREEAKNISYTNAEILNTKKKKSWTKYTEVNYLNDKQLLVKKSSFKSDLTSFYIIDKKDGKETKIKATDAGIISVVNNKIVWARTYHDPRWQLKDFSDIIIFDVKTKKEKRITEKQKLFAPSLSSDASKIVAVQYDTKMKTKLVFIEVATGKIYKTVAIPNNDFIRTPTWSEDDNKIVFTKTSRKGTSLTYYNLSSEKFVDVTKVSAENIGRPIFYKNYIIYNSPYSGIGNIYAIDYKTKERFQITSRKFGAYNPKILANKLVFSDYTVKGYDIAEVTLGEDVFKPIETVKKYTFKTAETLKTQEQGKNLMNPDLMPNKTFEIKKYNKLKQAINIHSWGPFLSLPSSVDLSALQSMLPEVGFNIYSANMLNTIYGKAGVKYNFYENTFGTDLTAIFKKYYPEFSFTGAWNQRHLYYGIEINNDTITLPAYDKWEELSTKATVSIPLDYSSGIYNKGASIKASYALTQIKNKEASNLRYIFETNNGNFSTLSYSGSLFAFRHQATQGINPKFGYFIFGTYQHTPFNTNIYGSQFSAIASVYLPGFFRHHSLNIKAGFEKQRKFDGSSSYYWFRSPQSFPRGYTYNVFDKFTSLNANYTFPIWYPDFNIGAVLYFKRLRANIFADYANLSFGNTQANYLSSGLELYLQMHVFRLSVPIEIGGRVSYLQDGTIVPELIMFSVPL